MDDAEANEFKDILGNDHDESVVVDVDEFEDDLGNDEDASVSAHATATKPAASVISFKQWPGDGFRALQSRLTPMLSGPRSFV